MTQKFQQGGILAQIQQLPQEQQQQIMQAFAQWAQQKGVDINQLQQDPNALEQALTQFMQEMQTQAARHGAKLNYIKSLKNQCPEGEELYYYKKGGSVGCGCKKKEDGGEIEKAQKGTKAVDKFKNRKQDQATKDSIAINKYNDIELMDSRPGTWKKNKNFNSKDPNSRSHIWTPDRTKAPYKKAEKEKCGSKIKKHQEGSIIELFKNRKRQ